MSTERLGVALDGLEGRLGSTTARLIRDASLGLWLCSQPVVDRLWMHIFGWREVHTLQNRRCLFATYDNFWAQVGRGPPRFPLCSDTLREILTSIVLMPMRFPDLRASIHPVVTSSDASETGGAVVASCGLKHGDVLGSGRPGHEVMLAAASTYPSRLVAAAPVMSAVSATTPGVAACEPVVMLAPEATSSMGSCSSCASLDPTGMMPAVSSGLPAAYTPVGAVGVVTHALPLMVKRVSPRPLAASSGVTSDVSAWTYPVGTAEQGPSSNVPQVEALAVQAPPVLRGAAARAMPMSTFGKFQIPAANELIRQFLRRAEYRGADVRVDVGHIRR